VIDLVTNRFPGGVRKYIRSVISAIGFGTSLLIAYNVFLFALRQLKPYPQTTDVLKLVTAPFQFSLVLALLLCSIAFLFQTFDFLTKKSAKENGETNIL